MEALLHEHAALLWTTSRPETVRRLVPAVFRARVRRGLRGVWDRSSFADEMTPAQYDAKTQVYKRLDRVWADPAIQRGRLPPEEEEQTAIAPIPWSQADTLLVDDSWQKGRAQPFNLLEVPVFTARRNAHDDATLPILLRQVRVLAWYADVSCKVREWVERREREFGGRQGVDGAPRVLSQEEYDAFWGRVLLEEEEELGLEEFVLPQKEGSSDEQSESPPPRPARPADAQN
ncbi:hypothetical protein KEM52_001438 [Ascosphaera acerosa]|nr:hypothetical protein KEM52_001438 [Ascosphaera acerosa]